MACSCFCHAMHDVGEACPWCSAQQPPADAAPALVALREVLYELNYDIDGTHTSENEKHRLRWYREKLEAALREGQAAAPAVPITGYAAIRAVLETSRDCHLPEAVAEDDGEVALDWGVNAHCTLSVSIGADGRLSWAALIGDWKDHASCVGEPDARLQNAFRRYAKASEAREAALPARPGEEELTCRVVHVNGCDGECSEVVRHQPIDVEAMRANLHATFNGGWHEVTPRRAYHHGIDTVCNILDNWQQGKQTNGILPEKPAASPGDAALRARLEQQTDDYLEGVEFNGPLDSFYEHAVKARSQYDEQYRAMATEILAARKLVRSVHDALAALSGPGQETK